MPLSNDEFNKIIETCDEDCPDGLQRTFFYVASLELAWRGGEGSSACIQYFTKEINNEGNLSGRIEYNTVFSKTAQGGSKKLSDSKWLVINNNLPRSFIQKSIRKRGNNMKSERLFLTPNSTWNQPDSKGWYKNCPLGKNTISTWFKSAASNIGIDIKRKK